MKKRARYSKSKSQRKSRKQNNFLLFKIIDPVIQSGLYVYIIYYGLDPSYYNPFDKLMLLLPVVQLVSAIVNLFIKEKGLAQGKRVFFLVLMVAYTVGFHLAIRKIKEVYVGLDETETPTIPLYLTIFSVVSFVISFWYTVVCYIEIKGLLDSANKGDGGS